MLGSMLPKFEVRDVLRTLEEAGLEKNQQEYDDERMIVEESLMALKDDMKFAHPHACQWAPLETREASM